MAVIPAALKDKVPPHNDDAEVATLGALLLDSEALATVIRYLRPEDFYKTAHQRVYQAILNLFDRNEAIDLITLTEELKNANLLEGCGGPGYISRLTSAVPTSANVRYYAQIVQDCSIRRALARISADIIATAHDESREVRLIIEDAERQIFEITDRQHAGTFQAAREIVTRTIEAIEKLYHTKDAYIGIPTGFTELDMLTSGFQNSEFIVIGARPSVGKTALALSMASNIALHYKLPVGFFTLEMSSMALMQRLLAAEARIRSNSLRSGFLKPSDFHKLTEAASKIYEAPLYIEDTPSLRLLDLRALARRMKHQFNVAIIFVDYLTLVTAENRDLARHEQIAEISRSLKALARELDIPVVALSQVRRETEGKMPNLADLRESGSIEQDADVVIFLHRERMSGSGDDEAPRDIETELIVAKQRNGPVGSLKIAFIPEYTKFENLARSEVMP
ncbi:MAG: replicative DNA helicase [Spirochaetales bacterium]|nr:replicative DNA helicase [Spirochaetales bacterium]